MRKFDGVVIVSDIDGTFLGKNSRFVPENLEAIEYFKKEGGLFTFATGRELIDFLACIPNACEICNAPVIVCNGACIYDLQTNEILQEEFLPEPEASRIAEAARARCPHIPLRVSVRDRYLGEYFREITRQTFHKHFAHDFVEIPYDEIPHGNWYKLGWDGTPEELIEVRAALETAIGDGCLIQYGSETILEVQSAKGTKGAKLSALKQLIRPKNALLYAIGDYENDYIMLSMADKRAVPQNGIDALRSLPDVIEVCNHDEGAIADLIKYIESDVDQKGKVVDR